MKLARSPSGLRRRCHTPLSRFAARPGDRDRRRAILVLACVLGLDSADGATVGAMAGQLERAFHVSNVSIGLLVSAPALIGAIATLPVGTLADRVRRVPLLWVSILAWSAAMVLGGLSVSYPMLLMTRLGLGAVTATAGPTIASLAGDLFPARERGRVYGYLLAGDTLGLGVGFLLSGEIAAAMSWRAGFVALALPGIALAFAIRRLLPEPPRGGGDRPDSSRTTIVAEAMERRHIEPRPELILHDDPVGMSLWAATRLVLRIPTIRLLILSSSLGYFFLGGIRTFAVLFLRTHFGLPQATASSLVPVLGIGALAGVLIGGRYADRLVRHGRIEGRVLVPAVCFILATAVFLPGTVVDDLAIAVPLYILGAALLGAPNPPLDAARLDIVHPRLWGRAEAVRTLLRTVLQGAAPLCFGYVSDLLAGSGGSGLGSGAGIGSAGADASTGRGLEQTFALMLVPLLLSGVMLLVAVHTYRRDVASAAASEREVPVR